MGDEITNAVIVERIDNLKEHFGETLQRIEAQTIKTNGRVTALENWRNYMAGAMALLALIIPLVLKFWN